jgi:hypothetical protein
LHFKPIYGDKKLKQIQQLDQEKRNICASKNIKLIELDCQSDKYLNKKVQNMRWNQLKQILAEEVGLDPNTRN